MTVEVDTIPIDSNRAIGEESQLYFNKYLFIYSEKLLLVVDIDTRESIYCNNKVNIASYHPLANRFISRELVSFKFPSQPHRDLLYLLGNAKNETLMLLLLYHRPKNIIGKLPRHLMNYIYTFLI